MKSEDIRVAIEELRLASDQMEKDIQGAISKLVGEFHEKTGIAPSAIDVWVDEVREIGKNPPPLIRVKVYVQV